VDLNAAVQMFPTPRAQSATGTGPSRTGHKADLQTVALLATPQARDHFPPHSEAYINKKRAEGHGMKNLNDQVGGQLNPAWVSRLMGFPDGWLDL